MARLKTQTANKEIESWREDGEKSAIILPTGQTTHQESHVKFWVLDMNLEIGKQGTFNREQPYTKRVWKL